MIYLKIYSNYCILTIMEHICPKCNKQFTQKICLTKHLNRKFPCDQDKQTINITKKVYQCSFCSKIFNRADSLKRHASICNEKKNNDNILNDNIENKNHNYNIQYFENKNHKWYCGHYLKRKLGQKYCIILTQAYNGVNRFNGYYIGNNCEKMIYQFEIYIQKV